VEYFKELEEESIRDNFVIIYELMDEMMDFGYPQTTESKILQEYVIVQRSKACANRSSAGTLLRNPTNWRYRHDHLWP
jgi:AP-1 complex subunit mu